MSYILNALRKSERERQAIAPDTVTGRIAIHQPSQHKSSAKLIAALIVINLSVLIYVLEFTQQNPPAPEPIIATRVKPALSPIEPVAPSSAVTGLPAPKTPAIAEAGKTDNPAQPTASPAKAASVKKPAAQPLKPAPAAQTIEPTKPAAIKSVAPPSTRIEALKDTVPPLKPTPQSIPLTRATTEQPMPTPVKNDLPFLEDLPGEVSRSLPNLPINVFSYSSIPAERFVMIDMVKYVPGQRIKDQLELREIREDSIVVNFDNRTFKIRRP